MTDWYDSAALELEELYENGEISYKEFRREMAELNRELRETQPLDTYDFMDR